jgi:hypothetical protein
MFGGVRFELEARVTLTSEEAALINKYKVQDEVLTEKHIKIPFTDRALGVTQNRPVGVTSKPAS